ncbi:MAG: hypothetical protein ABI406_07640 [Ktedonobacteraceae bacterium]
MLSATKNPSSHREMLRCTQHDSQHGAMKLDSQHGAMKLDSQHGAMKLDRVVGAQFIA